MKNKERTHGFFCRETFMEQIQLLQESKQCVELFAAAFAYTKGEKYDIKDAFVKMAFSSWKTVFDYDKKEADLFHKMKSDAGKIGQRVMRESQSHKREAERQQQKDLFKEEAEQERSENDGVPLVEAEEVEPYNFEAFWKLYKVKRNKQQAKKVWGKLNNKDRAAAMEKVPEYFAFLEYQKARGFNQITLYPATYLNQRRWEDDYTITDTPQNYGSNKQYQSNYECRRQQQNAILADFMADAAASVQAIEDAKSGDGNI